MTGHYLMFNRSCGEALELYKKAFGAEVCEMQTYGMMPPNPNFPIKEEDKKLVLHARLTVCGAEIMCADASGGCKAGDNMYVTVTDSEEVVLKAWNELKDGAEVYMELEPSFFAKLHGSLRDKFGVNWMFTVMK